MSASVVALAAVLLVNDARQPAVEVAVRIATFQVKVQDEVTLPQLQDVVARRSGAPTARSGITLGAVDTAMTHSVRVGRSISGRRLVDVRAGYAPAVLYIAREFKQDACSYQHILAHERQHVQIFNEELATWHGQVTQAVEQANAAGWSNARLEGELVQLLRQSDDKVYRRHAELDSPAEYTHNRFACGGAVLRIAHGEFGSGTATVLPKVTVVARRTVR